MTAKPTPGEWTARKGSTTGAEVVGKKPRGGEYIIARCGGRDREANAAVCAAGPEMLAALEALCDRLGPRWFLEQNWADPLDAIAKAKGRTSA